jgi:hypothetical protein
VDVTLQISGLKEALAQLRKMGERASDVAPIARDIFLTVQSDVDERFASAPDTGSGGVVWGGATWPHLSEAYLNRNPRRVGGQILRDTGELMQSYGIGGAGNVAIARPDMITFGSALPKARGLARKRPQVFVHPALIEAVEHVIVHHVEGAFDT